MHCWKATGGQGVHREVESEGLEEQYRAVIEGQPMMNRSAKDGARSSRHYGGEGVLIHPSNQGVCERLRQDKSWRRGCDELKLFIASQRVRLPSGKGAAHQPQTSLHRSIRVVTNLG